MFRLSNSEGEKRGESTAWSEFLNTGLKQS